MSQDYKTPAFKKLLQKLQEESWQLELLISGFAIFGLFTAFPHISTAVKAAELGSSVRWFVVSSAASSDGTKVALSQYALDSIQRNGGSVEVAG